MRRARDVLRVGLAGVAFVGFGVGALLLSWLVLPVISLLARRLDRRRRRCQQVVRTAFGLFHDGMRLAGLVEFNHRTALTVPPRGPAVLIANHPTLIDVTALVSALGPTCYLAKRSLFHNPLIGPLLRLCGQIPSGGRTLAGNVGSLNEALDRLQRGHSVLLFPEGTRSPAGGLHTFRRGAFELARRAGVPVIPIVIRAEPPGLYRGLAWYEIPSRPIVIDMEILDPISATVATPTLASDLIRRRLGLPASGEPAARR